LDTAAGALKRVRQQVLGLLILALVSLIPQPVSAQSMQTILSNGPGANRLNVAVLSEGYTSSQLGQFLVDATNLVTTLLSHSPYQEYRNYVNAYAIQVASTDSGSDHPFYGTYKNTYFNSTYDSTYNDIITIPTNSTGQGRVNALLQTFMPQCRLSILLVNDPTYGGSDGFMKTAIVSVGGLNYEASSGQPCALSHETGHVLANLGDEYTTPYPGFPNTEEPNTTQQTNRSLIKWRAWISNDTPVPTPDSAGDGVVGLFQGAHYHTTGWYRPELNCAMGSVGVPFCAVCSEALVLAIYADVRPVDAFAPASTNLSVSTTQALAFSLTLQQPATHNLDVQWFTNGVPCSGATNAAFTLLPQFLPNASNRVAAVVKDGTPLVRTDPTNLLSQTVTWTVNVSLPQLRLDSPVWLPGGRFAFRVSGYAPQGFSIRASTNLVDWPPLSTNSLVAGQYWYTNNTGSVGQRSFRAVTPP
jgi:IgA Peptidase M64